MTADYWAGFLARRWLVIGLVFAAIAIAAAVVAYRDRQARPYQASAQLFVSPSPSAAVAGPKPGASASQVARDLSQVITSTLAASDMSKYLASLGVLGFNPRDVQGDIGASSDGRTIALTATTGSPTAATALVLAGVRAATVLRVRYLGPAEAARGVVHSLGISAPVRASSGHIISSLLIRVLIGAVIALAVGLAWDYLDDSVHSPEDLESWLDVPVLGRTA